MEKSHAATKRSAAKPAPEQKRRLRDVVTAVKNAAGVKGWAAETATTDEKEYKYATILVRRTSPGSYDEVLGVYEITCDKRLKITYHKTSFYSYGLSDLYDAVWNEVRRLPWVPKKEEHKNDLNNPSAQAATVIETLLRRFHSIARQLKQRHDGRASLIITDEYDVQDLLAAILRGLFDDVRPEEYSPSYAGGSSRLDFLLKREKIIIETKMATARLRDKQIGEQLMVDIKRYQQHPDCERLICFVYDPGSFLKNPGGLEADLSGIHDKVQVKTIVVSV